MQLYDLVRRTGVLEPRDVAQLRFDPAFGGRLQIGTGMLGVAVCGAQFDCGDLAHAPLYPLDSSGGNIPAACIANDLDPDCALNPLTGYAFGVPATGTPPVCTKPDTTVTVNTTVCAPEPTDGFVLETGQGVVFL